MQQLFEKSVQKVMRIERHFKRSLSDEIDWSSRLIGIKGARGAGKTTLMLQYMRENLPMNEQSLYVSLDAAWFMNHSLTDLMDDFVKAGGRFLFLDEVHKYPGWSGALKNAWDDYPDLKIVFSGSSLLEILNARADLSRRAITYTLPGLSFREYIALSAGHTFPAYPLEEIIEHHIAIAAEINAVLRPLPLFRNYLRDGFYPFFRESPQTYLWRLEEVLNYVLEVELPLLRGLEISYVAKIKQLMQIIAESVPFTPNVTELSSRIGINRNTLVSYFHYLEEANIINNLYKDAKGLTKMQKPAKILMENTNIMHALAPHKVNKGAGRETFFVNQLKAAHLVEYANIGDFRVDGTYLFEVGGKNKTPAQLKGAARSQVAADDIETGYGRIIPLWLFGFLR
ncbi:MAG: AAA family ATPase [Candidatus Cyclonatronum sp.]|uniref:ATP-binding protein n=1 Tax=Cyclonatronum sp. TaxID=3024185 RepID=UPI0025BD80AB|nr:AAA family ATPase [Cyclonatronum sp.]MCH8487859.1 AAA family ATPase [Cyclonatronum sp.]